MHFIAQHWLICVLLTLAWVFLAILSWALVRIGCHVQVEQEAKNETWCNDQDLWDEFTSHHTDSTDDVAA